MAGTFLMSEKRGFVLVRAVAGLVAALVAAGLPASTVALAAPARHSMRVASEPGAARTAEYSRAARSVARLTGRDRRLAEQALRVARIRAALLAGRSPSAALLAGLGSPTGHAASRPAAPAVTGTGTISGTVTAAWNAQPLAGVCAVAQNLVTGRTTPAISAQDGSYSITGLSASSYDVRFTGCSPGASVVAQFWNGQESFQTAMSVQVSDGQTVAGIDAAMQQAGTVTGLVTDTNGHRPSGVCVHLVSANSAAGFSGKTGLGRYTITNVPPGHYLVDFGCDGYPDQQFISPVDHQNPADYLAVAAGGTARLNARLQIAGQISGLVLNQAGAPVSHVCVAASNARTLDFSMAITGKTGKYLLRHLQPGRYLVQFADCTSGQRYASQWYRRQASLVSATLVPVASYRTTRSINAKLAAAGVVAGLVTSAVTRRPVPGVAAIAIDQSTGNSGIAVTDRHGKFAVRGLPTGSYQLFYLTLGGRLADIAAARKAQVVQGQITNTSATLPLGGSIAGSILAGNPAAPAADVCVETVPAKSGTFILGGSFTGPQGGYKVTNLKAGSYVAQFTDCSAVADQAPQWYAGTPFRGKATTITVRSGQPTTGIGGTLKPDGSLSGTVTGPGAQPLAGICATVFPHVGDPTPVVAITGADGSYTVPAAVPGSYQVEFSSGCGAVGYATATFPSPVTVTTGTATTGIDATLAAG
jgi:hypothetical protein